MSITSTPFTPFTCYGVQTVAAIANGYTTIAYKTVTSARDAERWLSNFIDAETCYTDDIDVTYYGYDPTKAKQLLADAGYPDATGKYDPATESIVWEQC